MNKKKSMGSNPLAYNFLGNANFDFIKKTDGSAPEEPSDEVKSKTVPEKDASNSIVQKKVVSYYLEEEIIEKISTLAEEYNQSKSSFVNDLISKKLQK